MAKKLVVKEVFWRSITSAEGLEVCLDDYETKEMAEEALFDLVLQYLDYSIEEVDC